MEKVLYLVVGELCLMFMFEFSCCDLIGQLAEKLHSHQDLELVADLAETDENLTVSSTTALLHVISS